MRYRITMSLLLGWCLGCLLGTSGLHPLPFLMIPAVVLLLFGFYRRWFVLTGLAALLIGIGYARNWRVAQWRAIEPGTITFSGHIIAAPDRRSSIQYLTVLTDSPIAQDAWKKPVRVKLLVQADRFLEVRYRDTLTVKGKLESPSRFDRFDYPLFLERSSIFGVVKQAEIHDLKRAPPSWQSAFIALRTFLEDSINTYLPEPESSFLAGLLLGSRRAIPSDLTGALQATGTSHLVAISGANITIVVSGALALLPLAIPWSRFVVTSLVAGGLAVLTGGSSSVVRGALVVILGSGVRLLGRRPWPMALILLAASLMLCINPLLIRADPSFQLSFGAYAGLLACGTWLTKVFTKLKIPVLFLGSLAETSAASCGTIPLTILSGTFAARGFIVNPLVLWLIPIATALGFMLLFTSGLPFIATLIAIPTWTVLHGILWIIGFSARLGRGP